MLRLLTIVSTLLTPLFCNSFTDAELGTPHVYQPPIQNSTGNISVTTPFKALQPSLFSPARQKALFFAAHAKDAQNDIPRAYLQFKPVIHTLRNMIAYKKIEDFIKEEDIVSFEKQSLIINAHTNWYALPTSPFDAMLLTYENAEIIMYEGTKKDKNTGLGNHIHIPLKKALNTVYKPFLPLINHLKTNEERTCQEAKHTFYHAVRKDIYTHMYVHTKLLELVHQTYMPHFLMLRYNPMNYSKDKDPATIRKYYRKNGGSKDTYGADQYHLLSTNHTLMGNMLSSYDCSLYMFYKNDNVNTSLEFDLEPLFIQYGLESAYQAYKEQLDTLSLASNSGILLELIAHQTIIQKASYLSNFEGKIWCDDSLQARDMVFNIPGCYAERTAKKYESTVVDWNKSWLSYFIPLSLAFWRPKAPVQSLNDMQWRLILTDDLLLNPLNPETKEGLKIKAYALDQNALDLFHTNIDSIFAKIKADPRFKIRTKP